MHALMDVQGRPLHDLRISLTDQCNFRCLYCMPKAQFGKGHAFLSQSELLSGGEIEALVQAAIPLGVRKVRLTGGEPLLRKQVEQIIERLARLQTVGGAPLEIAMTTNGVLLARKAAALKAAGLSRVTVSLDALDDSVFQRMNDVGVPVDTVLRGIDAALHAGFECVKVNVVIRRGWNDQQILPLAHYCLDKPIVLRFIEFMDVGSSNGWSMEHVLPSDEIVRMLQPHFSLQRLSAHHQGETAERWQYSNAPDVSGELGLISSVTQPFCGDCSRARITADGQLFTCLFGRHSTDMRALLRSGQGANQQALGDAIRHIWQRRQDHYSEQRGKLASIPQVIHFHRRAEMSYIGG
ncbi:GTP 3',8-cyclase MoaA [Curvibacter sp. CHRR-16]|uniref:GTP 3',8-cyclase MoaA n=1 Tax=Curvibacter sp. CHRR-16 TaxID=2835872 RepID=UPI001BDA32A8|nr:GTP 3',8-cyclase MoaA [Curvibacter sp. CHRR-16]MBT0571137.1 GTP 3',8-cyclase MoaA [Curvibacter sp. CHRR-16]